MRKIKRRSLLGAAVFILSLLMLASGSSIPAQNNSNLEIGKRSQPRVIKELFPAGGEVQPAEARAIVKEASLAQEKPERETFQATAMGQSTQLGRMFSINLIVEEYSTPEDQQILLGAFNSGGMKGLSNALGKMKSKGRLSMTGTLGYDVTYIRSFPTATGRKIRLVTSRPIRIGEAWHHGRSMDYNLSAIELDISNEKGKSAGILLPACQFKLDKEQHLTIQSYKNPWKLQNVLDR